jgi:hypothetical protein
MIQGCSRLINRVHNARGAHSASERHADVAWTRPYFHHPVPWFEAQGVHPRIDQMSPLFLPGIDLGPGEVVRSFPRTDSKRRRRQGYRCSGHNRRDLTVCAPEPAAVTESPAPRARSSYRTLGLLSGVALKNFRNAF